MSVETVAQFRSPFYEAIQFKRYQRQDLIRRIEERTGRRLAVYSANIGHGEAGISAEDIAPFQDILSDCEGDCDLDLLLQSPGGDIDSAEKLVYMIRERVRSLRILVVERAKSAATLIALAADEILMSSTSELGPIDPQVTVFAADGRPLQRPARSFLDGLEQIKRSVSAEGELNPAYYPLLSQLDPALLDFCDKAIRRSEQFAEKWLVRFMLRDDPERATQIARRLTDVEQYRSHGMVIDWREAREMGLKVSFLETDDPLWRQLWSLFLAYHIESATKIFETRKVSLAW
jgi:ATP-dependent protease ClpP protease subunit